MEEHQEQNVALKCVAEIFPDPKILRDIDSIFISDYILLVLIHFYECNLNFVCFGPQISILHFNYLKLYWEDVIIHWHKW